MKNRILILTLTIFSLTAFAQEKKEVKVNTEIKVENNDGQYHLKIVKEVDGKKTTIDKTYNSLEEMKNDPELEGIELHVFDGDGDMAFFSENGNEGDHDVKVIVDVDSDVHIDKDGNHKMMFISEDGDSVRMNKIKVWVDDDGNTHVIKDGKELNTDEANSWTSKDGNIMMLKSDEGDEELHEIKVIIDEDGDKKIIKNGKEVEIDESNTWTNDEGNHENVIFFKSGDGDEELHDIKVWIDDDGKKHIMKNGEEIDLNEENSWTDKDGNVMKVEKSDGKVMILSDKDIEEYKTKDGQIVDLHFLDENSKDGQKYKVMIIESDEDGDGEQVRVAVKVIEHITIHLEDVEENEFSDVANINAKVLKTNDLNYYPNPNSGKFSLAFKASKRPTEVKITSLEGKVVYTEELQNFEGSYQNEIDLSTQKKGIYLLQIIQGNKAVNKKIIIE